MGKSAMSRLHKIWRSRTISNTVKERLVRSLIFAIFLYGSETWTIRIAERRRIDAFEMWCWRKMLRVSWTENRTNNSILQQLGIKTRLSAICSQRILQFFGHVARRGGENLERLMISGNVEGRRARGRFPTRWTDHIQKIAGGLLQDAMERTPRGMKRNNTRRRQRSRFLAMRYRLLMMIFVNILKF